MKKSFRQLWWCFALQEVNNTKNTESTRALQTNNPKHTGPGRNKNEYKLFAERKLNLETYEPDPEQKKIHGFP